MPGPQSVLRKLRRHLQLLKDDPEKFGFNLLQFSNPQRFQDKLLDVQRAAPLQVRVDAALASQPALNVLQPVLSPQVMTGGPNTVVNLALWVARQGVAVRIVTTRATPEAELRWFWQHLLTLSGQPEAPPLLSVASAGDAAQPLAIGPRDMFMATHWTTAQQLRALLAHMEVKRFFYLIQDFEPGFYAWSSNYALALETYGMDHIGVFNQQLLYDYVVAQGAGRYAEPAFAAQALVFEPAVDRANFYPAPAARSTGPRRLLFYARASNPRNLLGLGLDALRAAVADPVFAQGPWEFWAIGGNNSLPPISLGQGHTLQPAPWCDYRAYGELLRRCDVLLCPMLSPHTSYPVLEMAACGGRVVTTRFGSKTAARLQALSANILGAPASEEGLAQALVQAARLVHHPVAQYADPALPPDWKSALQDTAQRLAALFQQAHT
jgi:O-antigen biosynthesis protein